jgi:hypothetical protein
MHRTLSEYTLIIANEFQYIELFDSKDISIIVLPPVQKMNALARRGSLRIGSTNPCIRITVICQIKKRIPAGYPLFYLALRAERDSNHKMRRG